MVGLALVKLQQHTFDIGSWMATRAATITEW